MFCMNCGTKLPDGAKFCMNCGAKVGSVDAAAPKTKPAAKKNVEMQATGNTSGLYVPNVGIYALGLHGELVLFDPADGERTELIPPSDNDEWRFNLCCWEGNVYFIEVLVQKEKWYVCKVGTNGGAVSKTEIRSDGTVSVRRENGYGLEMIAYLAQLWNGALWFNYEHKTGSSESQYFVCSISLSTGKLSGKRLPEEAEERGLFVHDGYGYSRGARYINDEREARGIRFKLNDPRKYQLIDDEAVELDAYNNYSKKVFFYDNKLFSFQGGFGESYRIAVTPVEKDWAGSTRRVDMPEFAKYYNDWIRLGSHLVNQISAFDLDTEEFTRSPEALREGPLKGFSGNSLQGFQEMPDGSAYYFNGSTGDGLKIFYLPADAWKTGEYETVVEDGLSLR